MDQTVLRRALGRYPTGVAVVTALAGGERIGMTVNSFASVSLDPPLVQFSVNRAAHSYRLWTTAPHFVVNLLRHDQADLSHRFARPLVDKWSGVRHQAGVGGAPVLANALCVFECSTWAQYDGGDHVILLGKVETLTAPDGEGPEPLVFHAGSYRKLAREGGESARDDELWLHGW